MVFPEEEVFYEGLALPQSKTGRKKVVFLLPLSQSLAMKYSI